MTAPDPAKMAEGLSEAQREAIVHGRCSLPRSYEEWSADCLCGAPEAKKLKYLGLIESRGRWPHGYIRTPLGLAVRDHLIGERV